MLKNRFYIGEVAYGGEIHRGEHEPILDRALFEAVQSTLTANGTDRQLRLKSSPAMLMGRIFDDRGNRMSPTHTNKRGVRYRYYLSQAVLQKRNEEAGSVTRVPAPEIEALVIRALRDRFGGAEPRALVQGIDDGARARLAIARHPTMSPAARSNRDELQGLRRATLGEMIRARREIGLGVRIQASGQSWETLPSPSSGIVIST